MLCLGTLKRSVACAVVLHWLSTINILEVVEPRYMPYPQHPPGILHALRICRQRCYGTSNVLHGLGVRPLISGMDDSVGEWLGRCYQDRKR